MKKKSMVTHCELAAYGYRVRGFTFNVESTAGFMDLEAEDFKLKNCIVEEFNHTVEDYNALRVTFTKKEIMVEVPPFYLEMSSGGYADAFVMECRIPEFSTDYEEAHDAIYCPECEAFKLYESTVGKTTVPYFLYIPNDIQKGPEAESKEALPLVIFNHGGGSDLSKSIVGAPFAGNYVRPENQKLFSCCVMASIRGRDADPKETWAAVKAAIDGLVEKGYVDKSRIYMTGESAGSLATMTFASLYPGYLAAVVLMNGGPMDIESGTDLENAVNMNLGSPWSDKELETFAKSGTAVMFVQSLGDILSVPVRYGAVYTKLKNFGMAEGDKLVWQSYTAEQYNYLLSDGTRIVPTNKSETAIDVITGKTTYTCSTGKLHTSSRAAANDVQIKLWLMDQTLDPKPVYVPWENEDDKADYSVIPQEYTKYQIYTFKFVGDVEVLCAMDDAEQEFYLYFKIFNDEQVLKGNIDDFGNVRVKYDLTGFLAGDARAILEGRTDRWIPVS